MALTVTVPVFQQRVSGQLVWTTLGLGDYNQSHTGGSAIKVQRKLVDKLRTALDKVDPGDLDIFQIARGIELVPTRLALNIRGPDGRFKVSGVYPLIAEPRWINEETRILVVYHPHRQEEWFAVEHKSELEDKATIFFRSAWEELDQHDIVALQAGKKDTIKSISFAASPRTLMAKLPHKKDTSERAGMASSSEAGRLLAKIGSNQTVRAMENILPTGMPRSPYRQQLQMLLCGDRKTPTIIVGPPGSGKTTVLYQWVADLLVDDQFEVHRDLDKVHNVWTVSGKRIIAGMSMLGDWEQRCIDLLAESKRRRAILAIEDIHLFGRLGQTRDSDRNLAEFFRGPLARGELLMVGECTSAKLQRLEDDAPSFASLFSRVHVHPTEPAETLQMMMHLARELEIQNDVSLHPFTYRAIIELGGSLFPWSAFPGKALDMLRQLVDAAVSGPVERMPRDQKTGRVEVRGDHVVSLMSRQTGLPENLLTLDTRMDVRVVRESFSRHVMGQPAALDAACDLIFRVRAGLADPGRPLAVNLFTGPTGTGKTEMARCIAAYLFGSTNRLLRLDMSEYASYDAAARLIGDRYSPRGLLTQRIREQPFCVVLFDEIEKAHPSVLNLLLQLFDEGRLTDAAGDTASFNHAVIIMTSNLGAKPQQPIGFGDASARVLGEIDRAVRDFFPPELFNRIDKVVPFRPLTARVAEGIAVKELAKLLSRRGLSERNIYVYANRAVKQRIVNEAFDPAHGARTVKRYLEEHIGSMLADQITTSAKAQMQVMRIYDADGVFRLHVEPLIEKKPEDADWMLASLLDQTTLKIGEHAPQFAAMVQALTNGDAFQRIDRTVRASQDRNELWYYADVYKDRVIALRDWFENRTPRTKKHARHDPDTPIERVNKASKETLLARMAEACFLAENEHRVADPRAHVAWIEILRVGHGRDTKHFESGVHGLVEWMSEWLFEAGSTGDGGSRHEGMLDAVAVRFPDGKIRHWQGPRCGFEATEALDRRPVQVVMKMVGLGALETFRGEHGCHIWRSLANEPEIVRVRVWGGDIDGKVRQVILDHLDGVRAFEQALEAGVEPLPPNPEALMPAVRTLQFRPPLRPGVVFPVDVEDFHTSYSASLNVRSLRDALRMLFWLRKSKRQEQ